MFSCRAHYLELLNNGDEPEAGPDICWPPGTPPRNEPCSVRLKFNGHRFQLIMERALLTKRRLPREVGEFLGLSPTEFRISRLSKTENAWVPLDSGLSYQKLDRVLSVKKKVQVLVQLVSPSPLPPPPSRPSRPRMVGVQGSPDLSWGNAEERPIFPSAFFPTEEQPLPLPQPPPPRLPPRPRMAGVQNLGGGLPVEAMIKMSAQLAQQPDFIDTVSQQLMTNQAFVDKVVKAVLKGLPGKESASADVKDAVIQKFRETIKSQIETQFADIAPQGRPAVRLDLVDARLGQSSEPKSCGVISTDITPLDVSSTDSTSSSGLKASLPPSLSSILCPNCRCTFATDLQLECMSCPGYKLCGLCVKNPPAAHTGHHFKDLSSNGNLPMLPEWQRVSSLPLPYPSSRRRDDVIREFKRVMRAAPPLPPRPCPTNLPGLESSALKAKAAVSQSEEDAKPSLQLPIVSVRPESSSATPQGAPISSCYSSKSGPFRASSFRSAMQAHAQRVSYEGCFHLASRPLPRSRFSCSSSRSCISEAPVPEPGCRTKLAEKYVPQFEEETKTPEPADPTKPTNPAKLEASSVASPLTPELAPITLPLGNLTFRSVDSECRYKTLTTIASTPWPIDTILRCELNHSKNRIVESAGTWRVVVPEEHSHFFISDKRFMLSFKMPMKTKDKTTNENTMTMKSWLVMPAAGEVDELKEGYTLESGAGLSGEPAEVSNTESGNGDQVKNAGENEEQGDDEDNSEQVNVQQGIEGQVNDEQVSEAHFDNQGDDQGDDEQSDVQHDDQIIYSQFENEKQAEDSPTPDFVFPFADILDRDFNHTVTGPWSQHSLPTPKPYNGPSPGWLTAAGEDDSDYSVRRLTDFEDDFSDEASLCPDGGGVRDDEEKEDDEDYEWARTYRPSGHGSSFCFWY